MAVIDLAVNQPTKESEAIRNTLSQEGREHFDDVYLKRKLGASLHIHSIGCMMKDVAEHAKENGLNKAEVLKQVEDIGRYFIKLRGESSTAIVNAVELILDVLHENETETTEDLQNLICDVCDAYESESDTWSKKIAEYGVNILDGKKSMLLYDYSSLVNIMLKITGENGHFMDIYLPESRFLDGGRPFVKHCLENGHRVHFFPDVAIYYFMSIADCALMGAETFYPNGDMINTIGSELVALACKRYEKPCYVPTSLIKANMKWIEGKPNRQLFRDLKEKIASHWPDELKEQVDFTCPNLDVVPAQLITSYITEEGVVPVSALFMMCSSFKEKLKKKIRTKFENKEKMQ